MKHPVDKHFKQLKQLEEQPPLEAWAAIEKELDKRSKRRTPIIWLWRRAAIAASFLLFVGVGSYLWINNQQELNSGIQPKISKTKDSDIKQPNSKNNTQSNNPIISFQEEKVITKDHLNNQTNKTLYKKKTSTFNLTKHQTISNNNVQKRINDNTNNENKNWAPLIVKETSDTSNYSNKSESIPNLEELFTQNNVNSPLILNPNDPEKSNKTTQKEIDEDISELELAILGKNNDEQTEEQEEEKEDLLKRKFDVLAYGAPLYFSSLNNSTSIPELDNYDTENQISYAYGVKAAYSITDRIKIRTGVGIVNLTQTSQNVPLTNSALAARNASFSIADEVSGDITTTPFEDHNISYASGLRVAENAPSVNLNNEIDARNIGSFQADVQQNIQYLEIPLEAEYLIKQGKVIGVSATGGVSGYFLTDNMISAENTSGENLLLGEANNLNDMSFSGNAGVKFDVNVTKQATFSIEPQFRYMINTVSDNSDFQPYIIGVNAGILIKL